MAKRNIETHTIRYIECETSRDGGTRVDAIGCKIDLDTVVWRCIKIQIVDLEYLVNNSGQKK
jgi:hypothetical protein